MLSSHAFAATTSAGGAASGTITLPATYSRVPRIYLDSDDDVSTDYSVTDADGMSIFVKTAVDASTPIVRYLQVDEAQVSDVNGEAAAANTENLVVPIAKSPLTVTIANGGNAKAHVVRVLSERSLY